MNSHSMSDIKIPSDKMPVTKLKAKDIARLALICAIMFVCKEAMSFIPNVHPLMAIIIAASLYYGLRALYPAVCFVILECFIYGLGLWTVMYIYIWPLAVVLTVLLRKNDSRIFWACFAGAFGLCFGVLCSLPYIFTSGFKAAFAYWISGIPYDLIHCVSNAVLTYLLLPVLMKVLCGFNSGQSFD